MKFFQKVEQALSGIVIGHVQGVGVENCSHEPIPGDYFRVVRFYSDTVDTLEFVSEDYIKINWGNQKFYIVCYDGIREVTMNICPIEESLIKLPETNFDQFKKSFTNISEIQQISQIENKIEELDGKYYIAQDRTGWVYIWPLSYSFTINDLSFVMAGTACAFYKKDGIDSLFKLVKFNVSTEEA